MAGDDLRRRRDPNGIGGQDAMATTYTWNTTTAGTWNTAGNWETGGTAASSFPNSPTAVALFNTASNGIITLGTSALSLDDLIVTAAVQIDISSGQVLASTGISGGDSLVVNAGTISMAGGEMSFGTVSIGGGTIFGYGTLLTPAVGTLGASFATSTGGIVIADENGAGTNETLLIEGKSSNGKETISGNFQIDAGAVLQFGTLTVLQSGASEPVVNFGAQAGTLSVVNSNTAYTGTTTKTLNAVLDNLQAGTVASSGTGASEIILTDNAAISSGTLIGTNSGTLEIKAGSTTYLFATNGTFTNDYVDWSNGTNVGTIWVDTQPCYAAGTRILTDRGEVLVEELAEGDMLVTLSGDARSSQPIKWIGERKLDLRQHPQPNLVAPVRISAHAFAPHLPQRDLRVSPDHCLFIDGKLVPAKLLINDMTIVQERDTRSVHYYHIELDRHSVLLAEGLPAESYLDTGNRAMFANAGLALVLHPEFALNAHLKCWEIDACAPLTVKPDAVKPIWDRLAERAESLGYQRAEPVTTDDPDLHLLVDGRTIRPISQVDGRFVFTLPARTGNVRLMSRASVPSHVEPYLDDWRNLGVAVRRIVVRDTKGFAEIAPDHPGLSDGWYQVERDDATMWRWTNGDALLPIARIDWPVMVEVHVGIVRPYTVAEIKQDRLAA